MAICLRGPSLDTLRRWFLVCCALTPRLSCNSSLRVSGPNGEVAERLKAPASKAGDGVPSFVGSNPTLSANMTRMLELMSACSTRRCRRAVMNPGSAPRYGIGFASLLDETSSAHLSVTGTIPPALLGTMYRIGPGRFQIGGHTVGHWLDGFALLASVRFGPHGVACSNRFLASSWYRRALTEDAIPAGSFDSQSARRGRHLSNDNANMNITLWRRELEAHGDTPRSVLIDPATLATICTRRRNSSAQVLCLGAAPLFRPAHRRAVRRGSLQWGPRWICHHSYRPWGNDATPVHHPVVRALDTCTLSV